MEEIIIASFILIFALGLTRWGDEYMSNAGVYQSPAATVTSTPNPNQPPSPTPTKTTSSQITPTPTPRSASTPTPTPSATPKFTPSPTVPANISPMPTPTLLACPPSSGNNYGSIDPIERYPSGDPPPERHPDLNIAAIRGYVQATGQKSPIDLSNGEVGEKTPQIWKITNTKPTIVSLYRIFSWVGNANTGKRGVPMPLEDDPAASVKQIQMIGIQTTKGESVKTPPVYGNPISPDYNAMVIFADDNNITLKYTREDNIGIRNGYAIQIEGLCVDPNLLQLYNQLDSSGRNDLPAVSNEQVIGTANSNEIRVVIRDTGDFLDPRSKLDWWQGY